MIAIDDADIAARGDSITALIESPVWRKYLQPWLADYSELLRDQLMNKASDPDGVTPHYAAFLAGQERMVEVLIAQLRDWKNQGQEIKQKGGDD